MRLKQLKLAGFKSFVEPTIVHFSRQLVAVVGPNGCGKSNIIDAVKWVMGESSVKHLRGESMVDVIFNGSSSRKPLGQASVELVFDNSLGRLGGLCGGFLEVSLKRVVTRGGESLYYLNGSRCRRRDITSLFHGTGSRVYSIIGQGTISQIVEAKPEELRVFLEEAAGVSLYKERRRETLERIKWTKENLTRLSDVRDEMGKQLQRLERQALAANEYHTLKEQELLCRGEILALKRQDLRQQQVLKQETLRDLSLQLEKKDSLLTESEILRIQKSQKQEALQDEIDQNQKAFYQTGTQMARLEESIQQQAREKQRIEEDKQRSQKEWALLKHQIEKDKDDFNEIQIKTKALREDLQTLAHELQEKQEEERLAKRLFKESEEQNQVLMSKASAIKRELQVTEVTREHTEKKRQDILLRLGKTQKEEVSLSLDQLQRSVQELSENEAICLKVQEIKERESLEQLVLVKKSRASLQALAHQLQTRGDDFQRVNSEYKALIATQAALKQGKNDLTSALVDKPRLADILRVEPEWQLACDLILNNSLLGFVLDTLEECWQTVNENRDIFVTLREVSKQLASCPRLIEKIKGPIPATMFNLESIYIANSLEEARLWLPNLLEHESIVTMGGVWLGQGWVQFPKHQDQNLCLLSRQQNIDDLAKIVEGLQEETETCRAKRHQYQDLLQEEEKELEQKNARLKEATQAFQASQFALFEANHALNHARNFIQKISKERVDLQNSLDDTIKNLGLIKETQEKLMRQQEDIKEKEGLCRNEKEVRSATLHSLSAAVEEKRRLLHTQEIECERQLHKGLQLQDSILRETERLKLVQDRLEDLAHLDLQSLKPKAELKQTLLVLSDKHKTLELSLCTQQDSLLQLKTESGSLGKIILNLEKEKKVIKDGMANTTIEEQALQVRVEALEESLEELGFKAETFTERSFKTQKDKEGELLSLLNKIKNLGAINLAAIAEFDTEKERKSSLDEQYGDLNEALNTLEIAIKKMDDETFLRLENTFLAVNTSFKALFPRLFGGGKAELQLTCDNLLEAGIVVMAQPPGKRNASIHLLSGGEKAMTAVALVFAIFQLNPSPFCMLDEVDAPLDDINIGRFCDLVKDMSPVVQFLFITHNKVTMELADDLIGVTMREPGVSRLVTVDVKQALTMR